MWKEHTESHNMYNEYMLIKNLNKNHVSLYHLITTTNPILEMRISDSEKWSDFPRIQCQ